MKLIYASLQKLQPMRIKTCTSITEAFLNDMVLVKSGHEWLIYPIRKCGMKIIIQSQIVNDVVRPTHKQPCDYSSVMRCASYLKYIYFLTRCTEK